MKVKAPGFSPGGASRAKPVDRADPVRAGREILDRCPGELRTGAARGARASEARKAGQGARTPSAATIDSSALLLVLRAGRRRAFRARLAVLVEADHRLDGLRCLDGSIRRFRALVLRGDVAIDLGGLRVVLRLFEPAPLGEACARVELRLQRRIRADLLRLGERFISLVHAAVVVADPLESDDRLEVLLLLDL